MVLSIENLIKSISKNFIDVITDGQDLLVKTTLVIKKINITDEKDYPSIIYVITPTGKVSQYNKNSVSNNSVKN